MAERWNFERELVIGLICIVACVLLALGATGSERTRHAMDITASMLAPLEKPAVFVIDRVERFRRWASERRDLLMELEELREENRALRLQAGEEISAEFKRRARPGNRFPIVFRDPGMWWEELRIGTGDEKYAPGCAVLDGSDLVGVITSQRGGSAWVRLITSAGFYVPVVVEETREIGVVTGDNEGGVWVRYLPSDGDYKPGMKILTVLGSRLPVGLPVGELTSERRTVTAGVDEFRVKTGADLFRLQYVSVLGGLQP
ncbi:hypothetical protein FYJ74_05590 [Pyramidobacter sp. SM-530-WT-4B]|uniref:Cell shape-determining protein MreC n=1 Tax=Pyramidobacter porci TaxID=2605789 RepID=A0A6L5YBI7_9BACT|nr:rod shape-determining protein MreC [Pyramidobacter porci]MCI6259957.1 hypothetical protein [Pyramidobacter sp.]MDY2648628.1 rod shape-determining protein MreC [Pyramidobacter porci]MST55505.1 hypothetical protein [Pyramidobacter porci]